MRETDQLTVRAAFHRAARWFPEHPALADEGGRLTYAAAADAARRCAALYHALGVRRGDRVALLLYPSVVHAVAVLGAVELGALPVGLHVRESAEGLAATLARLSPRVLVFDAALEGLAAEVLARCRLVTGAVRARSAAAPAASAVAADAVLPDDLAAAGPAREPMPAREDDPVAIVLSSGTTGLPKGIVHTNRTFLESARGAIYYWGGIKPHDSILNPMTTSFIGWYNLALPFLNVGAKSVFLHRWDPRAYLAAVERERITHVFLAPTMWRLLLREDVTRHDLSSVKIAYFAGEMMDRTTLQRIRERVCPRVANVYGSTESGSCSAGTVLFEEDMTFERLGSVGKPLLNADLRVIRPGGTAADELPPGERGEVIIRGPSVAAEVWDDPATSRAKFEEPGPWWHSGDEGWLDPEGFLHLSGRIDDMIISGGINVHPAVVEDALLAHPAVAECAVVGVPDPEWGQRIKAFVVPRGPAPAPEALDAFLRAGPLPGYQRPRLYEVVGALPHTATGKVNRRALRARAAGPPAPAPGTSPGAPAPAGEGAGR
jgi:acyl-CoA synthetase (AMP-forming)/AMP-acid ligase II